MRGLTRPINSSVEVRRESERFGQKSGVGLNCRRCSTGRRVQGRFVSTISRGPIGSVAGLHGGRVFLCAAERRRGKSHQLSEVCYRLAEGEELHARTNWECRRDPSLFRHAKRFHGGRKRRKERPNPILWGREEPRNGDVGCHGRWEEVAAVRHIEAENDPEGSFSKECYCQGAREGLDDGRAHERLAEVRLGPTSGRFV